MQNKLTRRELLKALIAGSGGIVAAGFVPEKWLKPVVKSGVLPVHAQASAPTPTPSPTPTQNFVEGYGSLDGNFLYAEAYVSAVPFTFPEEVVTAPNKFKLASPVKIPLPTDQPVSGVEVTLWIDNYEYPDKKTTDTNGHVEWETSQWGQPQDAPSLVTNGITLKFVIDVDQDEYLIPFLT